MTPGLCCLFHDKKLGINFKTYTRKALMGMNETYCREKILSVVNHNMKTLQKALDWCSANGIESFRVSSDLIPHMDYAREVLGEDDFSSLLMDFEFIDANGITLSMHPGQFVNLGSPNPDVVESSLREIFNHIAIAERIGCTEINIHLGGAYGDKESAKERFKSVFDKSENRKILEYLTIENDELNFGVEDCLDVAHALGIPVTMDIHHHRCMSLTKPSRYSEQELFEMCRETWDACGYSYQRIHISSPRDGYSTPAKSRPHSDLINPEDIPDWLFLYRDVHIDIEAKHKESAIDHLIKSLPEAFIR